ncbi:hypothetical protein GYH30_021344 [Glycine max]|nr:hypothetical protein GYH30_021344 [Glycine max]
MYLHFLCTDMENAHIYGFMDPLSFQNDGNKIMNVQSYLQIKLHEGKHQFYSTPYLYSVMDKYQRLMVYMAIQPTNRRKHTWILSRCETQLGGYECGYYVTHHMITIVTTYY